jgi:hypothetical protein
MIPAHSPDGFNEYGSERSPLVSYHGCFQRASDGLGRRCAQTTAVILSGSSAIRKLARIVGQRRFVWGWQDKFESTPGSLSSGANPKETPEMPVMKSIRYRALWELIIGSRSWTRFELWWRALLRRSESSSRFKSLRASEDQPTLHRILKCAPVRPSGRRTGRALRPPYSVRPPYSAEGVAKGVGRDAAKLRLAETELAGG